MADRKPLSRVQFTLPVQLTGHAMPVTLWLQSTPDGARKAPVQAFYDAERDRVCIGPDEFPATGGLVGHYRFAKAALGAKPPA